ncbi:unnamed protein product [Paramecium sonneborni]|uniref:Actin n=1 Tax=Paramecium sonneborni TaxID=65129 RepID=A0A8S1KC65_9CILI|nr:unnamed protein product [Paramecium sonneborni]
MSNENAVIIDNGSYECKAQIANKDFSRQQLRSMVKEPKKGSYECTAFIQETFSLKYPFENGFVVDMDIMEKIWDQILINVVGSNQDQYPVILSVAQAQPKKFKEKAIQLFFESYDVSSFYLISGATLQLYNRGKFTGVVVDSGYGITQSTPIFDGFSLPHTICKNNVSGSALTEYFIRIMTELGVYFNSYSEQNIANQIKEQFCYVSENYEVEIEKFNHCLPHELPDGNCIQIRDQRIRCPELLFQPLLIGLNQPGIHELIIQSIKKSDLDLRKYLFQNIILVGGTTQLLGFNQRLINELTKLTPLSIKPKMDDSSDKIFSVLDGAKLLLGISSFQSMWIERSLYDEYGPSIVNRYCWG